MHIFESIQNNLNEKINKDNIEINKAIANANRGTKNAQKVKDAGYEVDSDFGRTLISNPKTNKSVEIGYDITKDNKDKVDWKGKLDSTRPAYHDTHANFKDEKHRDWDEHYDKRTGKFVPKSRTLTKDRNGNREFDRDDETYFNGISKNINDYRRAVSTRNMADDMTNFYRDEVKRDEERIKDAQADKNRHLDSALDQERISTNAETLRQEILANARAKHKTNESEDLNEKYVDTFGGDTKDFINDVSVIIEKIKDIPTDTFGTHLAQQMVEDFLDTCNRQIEKAKRLDSGDEFYKEAEDKTCKTNESEEPESDTDLNVGDEIVIPYARGPKYTEDKSQWVTGKIIKIDNDYVDLEVPTTLTVTKGQLEKWKDNDLNDMSQDDLSND